MSHFDITCPEDYQKYFHVNEQGNVWLDGRNNPIPLSQELTKRINSIPPYTIWSGRHTRSGVHSKDIPPHKVGPHNSTGNTQALPSLDTPTSPISIDQEMHGEIVQGVLANCKIPRSLVAAAWERARNHINPNKIDNLQSHHQMSPPVSNSSHSNHKSTASDFNKDSNPQQIDLNMVMDHVKSLENKIRQESEKSFKISLSSISCLGVILLHLLCVLRYTTARLQVLFSLHHLGGITKGLQK